MKFGTSIAVTNTSIFRYSARLDVHWFPWKQQFIKIHEFRQFIPQFIGKYFHFNASNLFTKFDLVKVQLNPKFFLPLMKTTSFLYYFSEKIISIDKIPPILQAFKVVLSCPTTEHGGIWVGPLLTSSKDMAQNTQETFDWVSSAVKTYLGYLCFIFCRKWTTLLNERSVSSSNAIWSLATFSTATMYIYFFDFEVRVASRVRHTASHDRQFAGRLIKVKTMAEELTYNYWGVIKMSVKTNIFAEKFVF